ARRSSDLADVEEPVDDAAKHRTGSGQREQPDERGARVVARAAQQQRAEHGARERNREIGQRDIGLEHQPRLAPRADIVSPPAGRLSRLSVAPGGFERAACALSRSHSPSARSAVGPMPPPPEPAGAGCGAGPGGGAGGPVTSIRTAAVFVEPSRSSPPLASGLKKIW